MSSSEGHAHTLPLQPASLACFYLNSLCVCSHLSLCYVSNNKLCTCIYSFRLHEKCIFHQGQESGKNRFEPPALTGLEARIPGFHQGYPDSIPGHGINYNLTSCHSSLLPLRDHYDSVTVILNCMCPTNQLSGRVHSIIILHNVKSQLTGKDPDAGKD